MSVSKIAGTVVPLVTPFDEGGEFDPHGMELLIDFVLEQGADALMATALTGEGPLLSPEETRVVWRVVMERAGGRIPVVPAVVSTTTRTAVALAKEAQAMDAPALMVVPVLPELYAGRSYDDIYGFYADVAAAVSLPIILFNYPSLTGIDFVPPLVERLLQIDNIRYIKESTGDSRRVHSLHRRFGDRLTVICGAPNFALESLALGCQVWLTGIMNVVPRSAQQLMRAMAMRDLDLARRVYYRQILPLMDVMAGNNNPTGTIKAGVCARGVDVGAPRRPGSRVSPEDYLAIKRLADEVAKEELQVAGLLAANNLAGRGRE